MDFGVVTPKRKDCFSKKGEWPAGQGLLPTWYFQNLSMRYQVLLGYFGTQVSCVDTHFSTIPSSIRCDVSSISNLVQSILKGTCIIAKSSASRTLVLFCVPFVVCVCARAYIVDHRYVSPESVWTGPLWSPRARSSHSLLRAGSGKPWVRNEFVRGNGSLQCVCNERAVCAHALCLALCRYLAA